MACPFCSRKISWREMLRIAVFSGTACSGCHRSLEVTRATKMLSVLIAFTPYFMVLGFRNAGFWSALPVDVFAIVASAAMYAASLLVFGRLRLFRGLQSLRVNR